MDVRLPLGLNREAPEMGHPCKGPFPNPSMASQPVTCVDSTIGNPNSDVPTMQERRGRGRSNAVSACPVDGRFRRWPVGVRAAGYASITGTKTTRSLRFASVIRQTWQSAIRCRFVPDLARSVGFGPVGSPLRVAGMLEKSLLALLQSIRPSLPSSSITAGCNRFQPPASC